MAPRHGACASKLFFFLLVLLLLGCVQSVAAEATAAEAAAAVAVSDKNANGKITSRFAYVTVHYEGTSRDAEYVLGVQVLMQSIKLTGTPYDLVVLASDSVSEESKRIFRSIGCRVLDVTNIENPFLGGTLKNKGFIYTLNKLHVWNLLEYERVVYLDADNVLIRNADELFLCGHFCAVFMNPCHFHTGLLVVTPNAQEYERLLNALGHLESFDGADQGFLSSMYSDDLRRSQLFKPGRAQAMQANLPKGMRLPVGYNINHKYFYEQYHWKLFYLRHFASMTSPISPVKVVVESARGVPAVTVGFPMAPVLKPWYWWAAFVMDLNAIWHDIRATLPRDQEHYALEEAIKTLVRFVFQLALLTFVLYVLKISLPMALLRQQCSDFAMRNNKLYRRAWLVLRIVLIAIAARIAPRGVHPLAPVHYGYSLTIFMNVFLHIYAACVISNFWNPLQSVNMPPILYVTPFWTFVAATTTFEFFVVWVSTWAIFPNILWRLVFMTATLFLCGLWQVQFYKLCMKAEFGGKKERLRSL
ncbi:hypothetical protein FI667_g13692, partial [Globisporangium splendens]